MQTKAQRHEAEKKVSNIKRRTVEKRVSKLLARNIALKNQVLATNVSNMEPLEEVGR